MQYVEFMYSTCTGKTFVFIIATKHSIAKFSIYFGKSVCTAVLTIMYMFVHSCTCIIVYENTSRAVVQIMYMFYMYYW